MSLPTTNPPAVAIPKWRSYSRLMKLHNPDLGLYPLVTMALASVQHQEPRYWLIMILGFLFCWCASALAITLDDIGGYIDGVDQLGAIKAKRNQPKPLVTGELTLTEAKMAAMVLIGFALILMTGLAVTAFNPLLAIPAVVMAVAVPSQYSVGLKLSYYGLGETVILYGAVVCAMLPYWLLNGTITGTLLLTAILCGLPMAALVVNSHLLDYDADRAKNRRTLAVLVGASRVRWIAAVMVAAFWVIFFVGMATHMFPWSSWLWLTLLPLHARTIYLTFKGDSATARLLAFWGCRYQIALFVGTYLLANHASWWR